MIWWQPCAGCTKSFVPAVITAGELHASGEPADVARGGEGDTVYALDVASEAPLVEFFEREIVPCAAVALIAEGIPGGSLLLPPRASEIDVRWRVIVDPIDGTRPLMYQKRSGWILTGIAANRGPGTGLHDIQAAVQTEIPIEKQYLADVIWAVRGEGVEAERWNG